MKKFIKVHDSDDNTVIVVSVNEISVITRDIDDDSKYTSIYFSDGDVDTVTCNESVEKIETLLQQYKDEHKFIKVHDEEDNSPILINVDDIVKVTKATYTNPEKNYTEIFIYTDNIDSVICNESVESIYNMIIN